MTVLGFLVSSSSSSSLFFRGGGGGEKSKEIQPTGGRVKPSFLTASARVGLPAELKHISKRRKRN